MQPATVERAQDATLAARARDDLDAFAELYRRYLCPVYSFIRSQTPDVATAEDLTAQTFFKALRSAHTFRGDGSYESWLFQIARNSVATWRRRSRSDYVLEALPESVDPSPSPVSAVLYGESRDFLWGTVRELPPAQREVVTLRYLLDLPTDEIADITKRTSGAVRILLHRAHTRLRKLLENHA